MLKKFKTTQTQMSFGQTDLLLQQNLIRFVINSCLKLSQMLHKDIFNKGRYSHSLVTIHGRTNWL